MTNKPEIAACHNMCCPLNGNKGNRCLYWGDNADVTGCDKYTTTPTTSIPVAELEKLRADKERMDWLERWSPRIYFNAAGNWAIERPGEEIATGVTLTEALDKDRAKP